MQNNTPRKPLLLTPREAAEALHVSPRTLWGLSHEKRTLPYVKIGKLVRYCVKDLERWIDERMQGGRP